MAVTVFKTFSAGEVLTAADLNSSFTKIVDNGEDLGWPATKAKDLDGQELILDADADTSITASTDDQIDFRVGGTDRGVMTSDLFTWKRGFALDKGGDITSASPLVIDVDGSFFDVSGTTSFTTMTVAANKFFMLQFDDILTMTHAAGTLDLPGKANIVTAAGDHCICYATAANVVRVLSYERAAGPFVTKGGDLTSASPLVIDTDGSMFDVTGNTNFSAMTVAANRLFILQFDGTPTMTHGADTLDLPGGQNITTANGDNGLFYSTAANVVRCISWNPVGQAAFRTLWDLQQLDADTLKADVDDTLTAGFAATADADGTKTSGTYTPTTAGGNFKTATNGGAHTLAPQTEVSTIIIQYTNDGSAGAITTSGFDTVTGDAFTTTNGHDFMCYLAVIGTFQHLHVTALQ